MRYRVLLHIHLIIHETVSCNLKTSNLQLHCGLDVASNQLFLLSNQQEFFFAVLLHINTLRTLSLNMLNERFKHQALHRLLQKKSDLINGLTVF